MATEVTDLHGPENGSAVVYHGARFAARVMVPGVVVANDNGALTVLDHKGNVWYCELDVPGTYETRDDNVHVLVVNPEHDGGSVRLAPKNWAADLSEIWDDDELEREVLSKLTPDVRAQVTKAMAYAAANPPSF